MTIEQLRFQHAQAKSAANVPKIWYTANQFGPPVVRGGVGTIVGRFDTPSLGRLYDQAHPDQVGAQRDYDALRGEIAVANREIAETYARMPSYFTSLDLGDHRG